MSRAARLERQAAGIESNAARMRRHGFIYAASRADALALRLRDRAQLVRAGRLTDGRTS